MVFWQVLKIKLKRLFKRTPKYTLCDDNDGGFLAPILITSGKFKGVKFIIGNVAVVDSCLRFKTEILENRVKTLKHESLFTQVSGDILVQLIKNSRDKQMPVLYEKEVKRDSKSDNSK